MTLRSWLRRLGAELGIGLAAILAGPLAVLALLTLEPGSGRVRLGLCAPTTAPDPSALKRFVAQAQDWLLRILGDTPPVSFRCQPLRELLSPLWSSLALALAALCCGATLTAVLLLHGYLRGNRLPRLGSAQAAWLNAPTVLWAALLTAAFNASVLTRVRIQPAFSPTLWLFPSPHEGLRWGAAVLVLTLGGGTLWHLYSGLRLDLATLITSDGLETARANGWPVMVRMLRQVTPRVLERLVSRLPVLLGEGVAVEYIFTLDGTGRTLITAIQARDEATLLTLTAALVGLSVGARATVRLLEAGLDPMRQGPLDRREDAGPEPGWIPDRPASGSLSSFQPPSPPLGLRAGQAPTGRLP